MISGTTTIEKRKIGDDVVLKITRNDTMGRIYVEFSDTSGKLVWQKTFQDNYFGHQESKEFQKAVNNLSDLKKHFGL